jgi:arginine decarboxylase
MKVNQRRSVVERLMAAGYRYEYGLEVGTKAELAAALTYRFTRTPCWSATV